MFQAWHWVGFVLTISVVTIVGVGAGRLVHSAADFTVGGRRLSPVMVAGSLIGAFVGGTSIIGTGQAAFIGGLNAWWFTIGAGLGCLVLAVGFAGPLRRAEVDTIPQFLGRYYGKGAATWASLFITAATITQVTVQIMAATPLVQSLLPVADWQAAVGTTILILLYVFFGGFLGAGLVGVLKTVLLSLTVCAAGLYAIVHAGGGTGLISALPPGEWLNLFSGGVGVHLGEGLSVVVGFISTQSYLQPIFAGRNEAASRSGALLAAGLIPLMGLAAAVVGMFMRAVDPALVPGQAVPAFLIRYFPGVVGGIALATLLISLIISAANLLFGMTTTVVRDMYQQWLRPQAGDREVVLTSRMAMIFLAAGAYLMARGAAGTLILKWSFLSMTIRGVTVFLPLMAAVMLGRRFLPGRRGAWAVGLPPFVAVVWSFLGLPVPPLVPGLVTGFCMLMLAAVWRKGQARSAAG